MDLDANKQGKEEVTYNSELNNYCEEEELKSPFNGNQPRLKKVKKPKSNAVAPLSNPENAELDDNMIKISTNKDKEKVPKSFNEKFRDFWIKNRLSAEYLTDLKEESARELLKIQLPITIVLNSERRTELMSHELRYVYVNGPIDPVIDRIFEFDKEIDEDLKTVRSLKDFLKVLVKFYNGCRTDLVLWDCTKAILSSGVFELDELPKIFDMNFTELLEFACKNNLSDFSKKMVIERGQRIDLVNTVLKVFKDYKNDKLGNELFSLIGEQYGRENGSAYYAIMYELLADQIFNET